MCKSDVNEANDWWDTLHPEQKEEISGFRCESYANLWFDIKSDEDKYLLYINNTEPE